MAKINDFSNWKVWKINDYEWLAGIDLEGSKKWYLEYTGLNEEEDEPFYDVYDVDLDKEGMWIEHEDIPVHMRTQLLEEKHFHHELFGKVSYKQALEILKPNEPCIIATTEW